MHTVEGQAGEEEERRPELWKWRNEVCFFTESPLAPLNCSQSMTLAGSVSST